MGLKRIKMFLLFVFSSLLIMWLPNNAFSQTFDINIDARSLTAQFFQIYGATDQLDTADIQSVSLEPNQYRFYTGYQGETSFWFTVNESGLIEYDSSLNPVLDGAGTSALVVKGASVAIDATALTADTLSIYRYANLQDLGTDQVQSLVLIPGQYRLFTGYHQETSFWITINQQGLIEHDSSLEAVLDGAGTSALIVKGVEVSIDATALAAETFSIYRYDNLQNLSTDQINILILIPGTYRIDIPYVGNYTFPVTNDETCSPSVINTTVGDIFLCGETNSPPVADAGDNLSISGENQNTIVIQGTASDPNGDVLEYRWLDGETVLSEWQAVAVNGEAYLDLNTVPYFSVGENPLTLEVSDGLETSSDEMILIVDNSAPHAAATGGGVYEIYIPVILGGQVSDFDGDLTVYDWIKGEDILFSGQVQSVPEGDPVDLPEHIVSDLALGTHTLTLRVDDGINDIVSSDITVEITDTTQPTLSPVPNKTILWPPNHKMIEISIETNAYDNSGGPVTLSATVSSNEPPDGLGDGDTSPDFTLPNLDHIKGVITLQLRAERSGNGEGRVYTVTITATDESGNSSQADVEFIVPHDKGKGKKKSKN